MVKEYYDYATAGIRMVKLYGYRWRSPPTLPGLPLCAGGLSSLISLFIEGGTLYLFIVSVRPIPLVPGYTHNTTLTLPRQARARTNPNLPLNT